MVRTHRNFQLLSDAQSYGFRYETYLDATFEALAGPLVILLMAVGIVLLITGNWETWARRTGRAKNR